MAELWRYEKSPDWKKIVESVPCPQYGCGAMADQPCRNVGAIPGTLNAQKPRDDWHMTRKFVAVAAWETKQVEKIAEHFKEESNAGQIQNQENLAGESSSSPVDAGSAIVDGAAVSNSISVAEDRPVYVSVLPVGDGSDPGENEVGGLDEAHSGRRETAEAGSGDSPVGEAQVEEGVNGGGAQG